VPLPYYQGRPYILKTDVPPLLLTPLLFCFLFFLLVPSASSVPKTRTVKKPEQKKEKRKGKSKKGEKRRHIQAKGD